MLILSGIECEIALQLSLLRHSWLKNQILKMDAGYVVHMYGRPSLLEERESFERKIQLGGEFESKLRLCRKLAHGMVEGFSPAQLIELSPLGGLPVETQEIIKSVLHREYLKETGIAQWVEPMEQAIDSLEKAFSQFTNVWYQPPPVQRSVIQEAFEGLQQYARVLHELLGRLPEGIVLP